MTDAVEKVISGESWVEFCDMLKSAGQLVLENSADDELERAEGFRYLARLLAGALNDGIDPVPLNPPQLNYRKTRIGADNPDFKYGSIRISGKAIYRISGKKNDAYNFNIGAFHGSLGSSQGLQSTGFLNQADLFGQQGSAAADSCFEIIASADKTALTQYATTANAHWLALCEASNSLIIRQTLLNPRRDKASDITIDCLAGDLQAKSTVLTCERIDSSLGRAAFMVHGISQQFLGWTRDFKQRPNTISEIKPELLGMAKGDPNCQYNYGYFDLLPTQALRICLTPPQCEYWNIQLANHWLESLDNPDTIASINNANATVDDNGSVTVIISARDPGMDNWLDTQSHQRGVIALRWVGAAQKQPDPVCALVNINEF